MKKVFTLACAVAAMVGVSTTTSSAAEKVLAGEFENAQKLTLSNSIKSQAATIDATTQNRADGDEEWVKVSTGIWFEGPLAARFSDVDEAQWEVDIYECATKPGYIRLNPYYEGTQPATLLGRANTVDLEICIADPDKCYFLDWSAFGSSSFTFGSYCTENGWQATQYGTLADGTITFPVGSVVYYNSGWKLLNGEMKIVLDKEAYVDYTLEFETPFCSTEAESYVKITKADAIATVKAVFLEGDYPMNDNNANIVKLQGSDVTKFAGQTVGSGLEGPNSLWSILYVGLDAEGNIKAQGVVQTYIVEDDADNWKALGDAVYTEGLISEFFTDIDSEELACTIEENVNTPGYYRLVNPYKNYDFAAKDGHNHYLYINATDPEKVYVEPSALGVYINSNFGYVAAQSWGYYLLDDLTTADKYQVWGKLGNGEITVPAFRLQLSKYGDGGYLNITNLSTTTAPTNPFKVVITPAAPSHDIEGVDENGAVELKDGEEIVLTAEGHDIYFAWEEVKAEEDPQALTQNRMPADEDFVILPAEAEGKVVFEAENNGDKKYLHFYAQNPYHGGKSPITSILITRNGTTDGVENVNASTTAPVEYFNLQGIRIDNPANGQVVIRRQGSEVVKIVK